MEDYKKLIEDCTHYIKDDNTNEWNVIEVSDIEEIMQAYHQHQLKLLGISDVINWVVCAERQPEEEGMYLVKNKYELTAEYHKYGKWAGKWTVDDTDGYEIVIDVSEWKAI